VYINLTITNESLAQATAEENVDFFKKPKYVWLLEGFLIDSFYLG
jgi:hypothetical protein